MSDDKPLLPIDPKELVPAGVGVAVGIALIVGFVVLAVTMLLAASRMGIHFSLSC